MEPFDKVKVTVTKDDIDYTYGGTIICTYTDESGTSMVGVSLLNNDGVVYLKESEVESI